MSRVFKKINFLLSLKGLSIEDWVNATNYEGNQKTSLRLDKLIEAL